MSKKFNLPYPVHLSMAVLATVMILAGIFYRLFYVLLFLLLLFLLLLQVGFNKVLNKFTSWNQISKPHVFTTFSHSQYICLLICNVQRFEWIIIYEILYNIMKLFLKIHWRTISRIFSSPKLEETISIFNISQLLLDRRVQRDIKHKASQSVTENRGGWQLLRDSYLYHKNKSLNSYLECKERRSGNGCKVEIVLDEQENVSHQFGQH